MRRQTIGRTLTGSALQIPSMVWVGQAAVAGVVAGIAMAMVAMVIAAIAGDGFWAPPRAITATFFDTEHAGSGFALGSVVVGVVLHMLLSAAFGVVYALLVGLAAVAVPVGPQVVAGMVWGLVLWVVNTFLIAPLLPGGELMTAAMPAWTWLVVHVIFGAMLGLLYATWRQGATALNANPAG